MRNLTIALATATLLAACGGGPARPQLKEVANSDGSKTQMTYEADQLSTVRTVDKDGKVVSDATVTYDGAQLKTMSITEPNKDPTSFTYSYDDSARLSKITGISGSTTTTYTATYSEGRVSRTEQGWVNGNTNATTTVEYDYNDAGQLKERKTTTITKIVFDFIDRSTETFTYDASTGLLKEVLANIDTAAGDPYTVLYQFTFDDSARLSKVVGGGSTYGVEYGTDGYVSRTTLERDGNITFKSYTYGPGSVTGVLANPLVNFGGMYDMAGKTLPTDQVYLSSSVMGLQ